MNRALLFHSEEVYEQSYTVALFVRIEGSPIRYSIATLEATVSFSTTFFCEVEHLFYDFASRPVVALWSKPVRTRGGVKHLKLKRKKTQTASLFWIESILNSFL